MSRFPSTNALGKPFDAATVEAVWNKAAISSKHAPLRNDAFGSLIWKEAYRNINITFGWEIDDITPVSQGGGDDLENRQTLQWENNRHKGRQLPRLDELTGNPGSSTESPGVVPLFR
jgi:hypothetical protein